MIHNIYTTIKQGVLNKLRNLTNHKFIRLTTRGNAAILASIHCAKKLRGNKPILTPDCGGWITYLKYPKVLGLEPKIVKTDNEEKHCF